MPQVKVNFGPKVGAKKVNPFLKNDAKKKVEEPTAPAPKQEVKVEVKADKQVKVEAVAPKGRTPKFVDELQKSYSIDEGKTLVIDCVCEGDPEPDVDWYFNGKIVKDEGRYKYLFEKDDVIGLEIKDASKVDEGEYKCVCRNKSGKAESATKVSVTEKPKPKEPAPSEKPKPKEPSPAEKPKPKEPSPEPSPEPVKKQKPAVDSESLKKNVFEPKKKDKKKKLPIEREGIKAVNPEKFYDFGDEIGRGKFSVVKYATSKSTGEKYAAKIIKFDSDSLKFAIREYDIMASEKMQLKGFAKLHEAYLVRKYLILIMDLADGKTLLDKVAGMHSITEDEMAGLIRQLLEMLEPFHLNNLAHLDLRPTNIRFASGRGLMILDYNSARHIANKKAGAVVDVIGDTEFCAPEMLNFDPVSLASDIWSIGVLAYILLTGISPYFYEDENQVLLCVQKVKYNSTFSGPEFETVTSEAKDFIKSIFKRAPEMRPNASKLLAHPWLSNDYQQNRKRSQLLIQDQLQETDERLYSEEEEEYIEASLVFRTFDEEEYESPEESDEEDEE